MVSKVTSLRCLKSLVCGVLMSIAGEDKVTLVECKINALDRFFKKEAGFSSLLYFFSVLLFLILFCFNVFQT